MSCNTNFVLFELSMNRKENKIESSNSFRNQMTQKQSVQDCTIEMTR